MAACSRLLVIDASLSNKLAGQLSGRGRSSIACLDLGIEEWKDPALLRHLAKLYESEPWVMVTADDAMPFTHAPLIASLAITIATVQPCPNRGKEAEYWKRETVHRWAHKMQEQPDKSIRRYSPRNTPRPWTTPRR